MFLLKIMSFLDLLTVIIFAGVQFGLIDPFFRPLFISAIYLIGKGVVFWGDFASIIDMVCGLYMIIAFFGGSTFIGYIVLLYLIQKILFGFFMD
ncbi:hypothetical protein JXM83_06410 [Candidatus Woesearchaeota archaeon]|nr:hypothetical protein [Candidatus Woesearchaeota archaeon]